MDKRRELCFTRVRTNAMCNMAGVQVNVRRYWVSYDSPTREVLPLWRMLNIGRNNCISSGC